MLLAFVNGIHRWPLVTRKMFPIDDVIIHSLPEICYAFPLHFLYKGRPNITNDISLVTNELNAWMDTYVACRYHCSVIWRI